MHTIKMTLILAICLFAQASGLITAADWKNGSAAIARSIEEMNMEEEKRETPTAREVYLAEEYPTREQYARIAPPEALERMQERGEVGRVVTDSYANPGQLSSPHIVSPLLTEMILESPANTEEP